MLLLEAHQWKKSVWTTLLYILDESLAGDGEEAEDVAVGSASAKHSAWTTLQCVTDESSVRDDEGAGNAVVRSLPLKSSVSTTLCCISDESSVRDGEGAGNAAARGLVAKSSVLKFCDQMSRQLETRHTRCYFQSLSVKSSVLTTLQCVSDESSTGDDEGAGDTAVKDSSAIFCVNNTLLHFRWVVSQTRWRCRRCCCQRLISYILC